MNKKVFRVIRILALIMILTLVIVVGFGEFRGYRSYLKCSDDNMAIVEKKYVKQHRNNGRSRRPSYHIVAAYNVEAKDYKIDRKVSNSEFKRLEVGNKILIKHACEDPRWAIYPEMTQYNLMKHLPRKWLE